MEWQYLGMIIGQQDKAEPLILGHKQEHTEQEHIEWVDKRQHNIPIAVKDRTESGIDSVAVE